MIKFLPVHGKREIRVHKLATFSLDQSVSKMFYLIVSRNFHAFLGVRTSAIVFIRSPSLEEIGGWKLQKMLIADGHETEVAEVSNYNQLVALALKRYDGDGMGVHESTTPEYMDIELD
uniref:Uncharacterized protein n=1 Tax=Caenorhabditis japonica TaxID=281687 RepID=A0A8R1ITW1_CAEJA